MTEYITVDLLWVLYCAFLEEKFPNASKPSKERFASAVVRLAKQSALRHLIEKEEEEFTNLGVKIPRSLAHC